MLTSLSKHQLVRYILILAIFLFFSLMFIPFVTPILFAILFAFALDPIVSKYGIKKSKRKIPTLFILLFSLLIIFLPIGFISHRLVIKATELARLGIQNTQMYHMASTILNKISYFGVALNELPNKVGTWALTFSTNFVSKMPEFFMGLFVFSLALYFFLTESKKIKRDTLALDLMADAELNRLINIIQKSSYNTIVIAAIVGGIQALIVAVGGWFFSYKEFLILFFVTFFSSFIPFVGAGSIAALLTFFSFMREDYSGMIGMAVICLVAGSIDNILKPILLSNSSSDQDTNPILTLLAIIGGVIIYGAPGLLLGPILTQLVLNINKVQEPSKQ